ncbi:hypothetical protein ABTX85_27275 [Streptomyces sp. NPDC096097]|uniref:hypothetical protein n=1 Tax=Streptomyces sp. NPDC096097 TaxID=3155546 RepID=UPI00331B404A
MSTSVQTDLLGPEWLFKHEWGFGAKGSDADFDAYMKSLLICCKGDGTISDEERHWVLGYCAALGGDPALIQELTTYSADDDITEMITGGEVANASRGALVFDAIRACDADGTLPEAELAAIRKLAELLGVGELVDQAHAMHKQEKAARDARNALLYPNGTPI